MLQPALDRSKLNDEWITENSIPDPENLPEIPGYHILVRPMVIRNKTKGGVFIPNKFQEDMQYLTTIGRVVEIGNLAYKDKERFPAGPWCSKGDYVCYAKHTGQKFLYKGIRFILMYDDQVLMKISEPNDIDPMYGLTATTNAA